MTALTQINVYVVLLEMPQQGSRLFVGSVVSQNSCLMCVCSKGVEGGFAADSRAIERVTFSPDALRFYLLPCKTSGYSYSKYVNY